MKCCCCLLLLPGLAIHTTWGHLLAKPCRISLTFWTRAWCTPSRARRESHSRPSSNRLSKLANCCQNFTARFSWFPRFHGVFRLSWFYRYINFRTPALFKFRRSVKFDFARQTGNKTMTIQNWSFFLWTWLRWVKYSQCPQLGDNLGLLNPKKLRHEGLKFIDVQ